MVVSEALHAWRQRERAREREREREREATPNKLKSILDRAACGFRAIDVAKRAGFGRAYRGSGQSFRCMVQGPMNKQLFLPAHRARQLCPVGTAGHIIYAHRCTGSEQDLQVS